jgi:hypothetical protein
VSAPKSDLEVDMSTSALTQPAARTPTAFDRCDRCGARAKVQVLLNSGGELVFCAHHGREHWAALVRQGADFRPTGDE